RLTATAAHDVDGVPGEARVVDDTTTRLTLQKRFGEQPYEVVTLDELAVLVEEKAAIVVAIPGQAHVRAGPAHHVRRGSLVLQQHRVGNAVGEGAVRLMVDLDE